MTKLSQIVLDQCAAVISAIQQHPFNQQLANGSLHSKKFAYYIEQDTLYLQDFSRSLATIASKAPLKFVADFLSFSNGALIVEQELVHNFFHHQFNFKPTGKLTPATLAYTNYLLQVTSNSPFEVGIAAILPCFWVYHSVGQSILFNADLELQNPYQRWIDTYGGEAFAKDVTRVISIFDEVGQSTSVRLGNLMIEAFYKSTVLEWHFFNDAHNQVAFDDFI